MNKHTKNWATFLNEEEFDRSKLTIKEKLNSKFWIRGSLQEDITSKLMEIAQDFYSSIKETIRDAPDFEDIIFTGSLASYNYHSKSDIDLHIVVDFEKLGHSKEILTEFFALKRIKWNDTHDIEIYGHEVEIYIQDENEEHISNGVYSILRQEWLVMPTKEDVDIDFSAAEKKYNSISSEIKELSKLFRTKEYKKVHNHSSKLKQKIKSMRKSGLDTEGVYSAENLAFKMLRNNDELKDLMSLKSNSYDKMMSLPVTEVRNQNYSENWWRFLKGVKK